MIIGEFKPIELTFYYDNGWRKRYIADNYDDALMYLQMVTGIDKEKLDSDIKEHGRLHDLNIPDRTTHEYVLINNIYLNFVPELFQKKETNGTEE